MFSAEEPVSYYQGEDDRVNRRDVVHSCKRACQFCFRKLSLVFNMIDSLLGRTGFPYGNEYIISVNAVQNKVT